MPTYEASKKGYRNLWNKAIVRQDKIDDVQELAKKIIARKKRYEKVELATGVPWFMVAVIHMRESGFSWDGALHNGDPIIGKGTKTTHVPAGRGPFNTWEDSAIDALTMPGHQLDKIKDWCLERVLYELEKYNGFGYTGKVNSPYLWSWSNLYSKGKYVADGKYDPNHIDTQPGCVVILKELLKTDADIEVPAPPDVEPVPPTKENWFISLIRGFFGGK